MRIGEQVGQYWEGSQEVPERLAWDLSEEGSREDSLETVAGPGHSIT